MQNKIAIAITLNLSADQSVEDVVKSVKTALEYDIDAGLITDGDVTVQGLTVEEMTVQKAKDVLKEAGYLMVFWCEQDIRGYELGEKGYDEHGEVIPPLTDDEVCDIVTSIENNFDASLGVNWDTINSEIWDALEARKDAQP